MKLNEANAKTLLFVVKRDILDSLHFAKSLQGIIKNGSF